MTQRAKEKLVKDTDISALDEVCESERETKSNANFGFWKALYSPDRPKIFFRLLYIYTETFPHGAILLSKECLQRSFIWGVNLFLPMLVLNMFDQQNIGSTVLEFGFHEPSGLEHGCNT